ncbi:DNA recombination protein RmuC [SAR86 cluster bacterium]|jgi:DNA recombination protein RmuC|nr:DNA recombination protein RmuC [SAR86 cluster bacterium]URQ67530.1 DNA recombination protein RmuC [SAR86 cluster bacterium]|tara:strand:+ start:326 stop:1210 length:885 start_codon:yes stop_codon:yes gene_type:complete
MDILIVILLIIVIGLIFFNTFKNSNDTNQSDDFLKGIDHSIETQRTTIGELSKDIQSFNEPLSKLNRYLSGGTLAGKFGEWSLESIIKDIFHSNQYESNAEVIPGSGKRVEFIIKLPEGLVLPIDAKFPSALFDNFLNASDSGDEKQVKKTRDDIRRHVLKDASDIKEKYVQSGITVDLGVMYIPSESLMQTIDSLDNIREIIFRDYRVLVMGPNSLAAYLISVHMGFRTLALNERAGEIMNEFGKLKKEFEKFSGSTEDLMKKVDALQKSVNEYSTRERQMERAIDSMDKLDS